MKLEVGNKMPDFTVDTPYERGVDLKEMLGDKKTALLFLRYAGCTLCRFDMLVLKEEYEKIREVGGKVLVVLQSNPDKLSSEIEKGCYPFEVICNPNQEMYKELEIKAVNYMEEIIGPGTMEKIKRAQEAGLTHGDYEGNEMQLPALFIVDKDLTVSYVHYSAYVTDMPDVDELAGLLKN